MHDVRVICRAEIGSYHHLVLMEMKIHGRSKTKRTERSWQLRSKRLRIKQSEVWARLGHLMCKVKHRTGEGINRAQGSLMGEVP